MSAASSPYSDVIRLAWPGAVAMLSESMMGLVDTALVGHLGAAPLAGVGFANAIFLLVFVTFLGFARSVKVCTAYAVGAGHPERALRFALFGVVIAAVVASLSAYLLQHSQAVAMLLGVGPEVAHHADRYLAIRALGLVPACMHLALMEHRQGLGQVRPPAAIGIVGNLVNAPLSYCLIAGHVGLPSLGFMGAAYGSVVSESVQLCLGLGWYAFSLRQARAGGLRLLGPQWSGDVGELVHLGLPTALHFGAEYLAFLTLSIIVGALPPAQVAAHQIALAVNRAAFLPGLAVSEAVSVLVGQALGAGNPGAARRAVRAGLHVAMLTMLAAGVVMGLGGSALAGLFARDAAVVALAAQLLMVAALFQVVDAVNLVMRNALRGAKDVRILATLGILIIWLCVPTAAYVLGRLCGLGVLGGWIGFVLEASISAVVFSLRWQRGAWHRGALPASG